MSESTGRRGGASDAIAASDGAIARFCPGSTTGIGYSGDAISVSSAVSRRADSVTVGDVISARNPSK
jgi:hypothetical protein